MRLGVSDHAHPDVAPLAPDALFASNATRSARFRCRRAYYGVQTRARVENFAISGLTAPPELVIATILIKKAAARANAALGRLPR